MREKKENKFPVALTRLTEEETKLLDDYASKNGVKRSQVLRKIVRQLITKKPELLPEEMKEFKESVRQLAGMARNLNQIARVANSGTLPIELQTSDYFVHLRKEVSSLRKDIDNYINATVNRTTEVCEAK